MSDQIAKETKPVKKIDFNPVKKIDFNPVSEQLTREYANLYKRLTDPVEREKAEMKEREKAFTKNLTEKAGL